MNPSELKMQDSFRKIENFCQRDGLPLNIVVSVPPHLASLLCLSRALFFFNHLMVPPPSVSTEKNAAKNAYKKHEKTIKEKTDVVIATAIYYACRTEKAARAMKGE